MRERGEGETEKMYVYVRERDNDNERERDGTGVGSSFLFILQKKIPSPSRDCSSLLPPSLPCHITHSFFLRRHSFAASRFLTSRRSFLATSTSSSLLRRGACPETGADMAGGTITGAGGYGTGKY